MAGETILLVDDEQNIVDLARIESGQVAMRQEPVDLGASTGERGRAISAAGTRGEDHAEVPGSGSATIRGDGDWLAQVFTNLVDNAIKHTQRDGGVTLAAQVLTPCGVRRLKKAWSRAIEVAASDRGEGVPPTDLQPKRLDDLSGQRITFPLR